MLVLLAMKWSLLIEVQSLHKTRQTVTQMVWYSARILSEKHLFTQFTRQMAISFQICQTVGMLSIFDSTEPNMPLRKTSGQQHSTWYMQNIRCCIPRILWLCYEFQPNPCGCSIPVCQLANYYALSVSFCTEMLIFMQPTSSVYSSAPSYNCFVPARVCVTLYTCVCETHKEEFLLICGTEFSFSELV